MIYTNKKTQTNYKSALYVAFTIIFMMTSFFFSGCAKSSLESETAEVEFMEPIIVEKNPVATFKIKGYGTIKIELYPDKAPNTVCNFIKLIEDGAYENSGIWRNQKRFVIQGGAPNNDSTARANFGIAGEYTANGYKYNDISHTEGVVSMARISSDMDSGSQQFFVCLSDACAMSLDGKYGAFGKIADDESMKVVKQIEENAKSNNDSNGALYKAIEFEDASVETYGVDYPDPIRLDK